MNYGKISDRSHLSIEIPLAHLCEIVYRLGHLLSSNKSILGVFWLNLRSAFEFIYCNHRYTRYFPGNSPQFGSFVVKY